MRQKCDMHRKPCWVYIVNTYYTHSYWLFLARYVILRIQDTGVVYIVPLWWHNVHGSCRVHCATSKAYVHDKSCLQWTSKVYMHTQRSRAHCTTYKVYTGAVCIAPLPKYTCTHRSRNRGRLTLLHRPQSVSGAGLPWRLLVAIEYWGPVISTMSYIKWSLQLLLL